MKVKEHGKTIEITEDELIDKLNEDLDDLLGLTDEEKGWEVVYDSTKQE